MHIEVDSRLPVTCNNGIAIGPRCRLWSAQAWLRLVVRSLLRAQSGSKLPHSKCRVASLAIRVLQAAGIQKNRLLMYETLEVDFA